MGMGKYFRNSSSASFIGIHSKYLKTVVDKIECDFRTKKGKNHNLKLQFQFTPNEAINLQKGK